MSSESASEMVNSAGPGFSLGLNKMTLIHMVSEVLILTFMATWIHKKTSSLQKQIVELTKTVDDQSSIINQHTTLINNLLTQIKSLKRDITQRQVITPQVAAPRQVEVVQTASPPVQLVPQEPFVGKLVPQEPFVGKHVPQQQVVAHQNEIPVQISQNHQLPVKLDLKENFSSDNRVDLPVASSFQENTVPHEQMNSHVVTQVVQVNPLFISKNSEPEIYIPQVEEPKIVDITDQDSEVTLLETPQHPAENTATTLLDLVDIEEESEYDDIDHELADELLELENSIE
ncbi:MAG: hypothetical protein JKX76_00715 [Colwellia sp.]|nr:hypothetical protein [Colwellia sp.]